jgi:hypothetical protein
VLAAVGLHVVDGDLGELGGAGELLAAQGEHAERGLAALELDLALDHLPLGLDVADRLEELGGHAELVGGVDEVGVDAGEVGPGVDARRVDGLGVVLGVDLVAGRRVGVVHAVETRGGGQGEHGEGCEGERGRSQGHGPLIRRGRASAQGGGAR